VKALLRPPVVLALLLVGSAVATFLFWRSISYRRPLDDEELAACLAPGASIRKAQHGISQLTDRWREGRPGMDRWTERLVAVSRRAEPQVRRAAAWAMQFAVRDPEAAARLRELAGTDPDEAVRRNAACSLAFGTPEDAAAARPVLRSMVEFHVVKAPAAGTVESVVDLDRIPETDAMVARLRGADGVRIEAVTAVPGRVLEVRAKAGDVVAAGAPLVVLAPDAAHVTAAAAALVVAGASEDAELLRTMLAPAAGMPSETAAQVRAAIDAIERRTKK
jgi:hypothetical protein